MIYKYFRFNENAISSLINNELWTSNLREFNDPFESLVTLDFECEKIQRIFEDYISKKSVCCFSRNKDNILMWSHYADNHKGFCIGIDEKIYSDENLLSDVCYENIDPNIRQEIINSHVPGEINKKYEKLITHKHEDWKYEEEVRMILEMKDPNLSGKTVRLSENQIKEIYFGCRMPYKNKQLIEKIMGDKVNYYQMKTTKTGFSLIETPIHN